MHRIDLVPNYRDEYDVVRGNRTDLVVDEVNHMLKKGWKCQGGIVHAGGEYCQAMIRQVKDGVHEEVHFNASSY